MIQTNAPADPVIHLTAMRIARRFVELVGGLLRDDERGDALRESYLIVRDELEKGGVA